MAFPVVESTATTPRTGAETTSPVTYPATVSPNALIVCIARVAVAGAIGWPGGWTELVEDSSDASDDVTAIAYKTAVGDEDGTTFNVTHGDGKSAYIVYSITGAADPASQAPQLSAVAVGTSTAPDPAALTPTGGAKDYLWLWLGGWEGEQTSPPANNPTNYTNPLGASTAAAGAATGNCRVASARRDLNAASEDPPSWTISASDDWSAWTMAVHPTTITLKAVTDGLGLADAAPAFKAAFALTEPLALATPAPGITARLTLTEPLALGESIVIVGAITPVADGLALAGLLPSVLTRLGLTEPLRIAETIGLRSALSLTDGLGLAELLALRGSLTLSDSLALGDVAALKQFFVIVEGLGLAEAISTFIFVQKQVADGLSLESLFPALAARLGLTDRLAILETPSIRASFGLTEALGLGETAAARVSISLTDALALAESIGARVILSVSDGLRLEGTPAVRTYLALTEGLRVGETFSVVGRLSLTGGLVIGEAVSLRALLALIEDLGLGDLVPGVVARVSATDLLQLAEEIATRRRISVEDTLGLAEVISVVGAVTSIAISDGLVVGDLLESVYVLVIPSALAALEGRISVLEQDITDLKARPVSAAGRRIISF